MTCKTKTYLSGVMGPLWITLFGIPSNLTTLMEKIVCLLKTLVAMTLTGRSGMTPAAETGNPTSAADLSSPKSLPKVPMDQIGCPEKRDPTSAKDHSSPESLPKSPRPPFNQIGFLSITHINLVRNMASTS